MKNKFPITNDTRTNWAEVVSLKVNIGSGNKSLTAFIMMKYILLCCKICETKSMLHGGGRRKFRHISRLERVPGDNLNFPCSIYQSKLPRLNVQNFCGSPSVQIYCTFSIYPGKCSLSLKGLWMKEDAICIQKKGNKSLSYHLELCFYRIHCTYLATRKRWRMLKRKRGKAC